MSFYKFIPENDKYKKNQLSDQMLNEELNEALKYDPSLIIEEYQYEKNTNTLLKLFNKIIHKKQPIYTRYNVYHIIQPIESSTHARLQLSASGEKITVIAYLHGIINGINHNKQNN